MTGKKIIFKEKPLKVEKEKVGEFLDQWVLKGSSNEEDDLVKNTGKRGDEIPNTSKQKLTVLINKSLHEDFKIHCVSHRLSMVSVLENLILSYLNENK